jgi:hypothetical protein
MSHSTNIHSGIVNPASPANAKEMKDKQDFVSFDIPLLIRVFELVREDIKTDKDLHDLVERLLSMKNKGVLTMDQYEEIASAYQGQDSGQMVAPEKGGELESIKKLAGIR